MRKSITSLLFLICWAQSIHAADVKYPVSSIPASLLKKANVVKRDEVVRVEIHGLDEAIYYKKIVLTIMNEYGDKYAAMVVGYDKLRKISAFEGALYDAYGNVLKRIKNKDIRDYSDVDEGTLFNDNRVKAYDFNYRSYPYTVEFEVEVKLTSTYSLPSWMPTNHSGIAVEQSTFSIESPMDYNVRYKVVNFTAAPEVTTEKNRRVLTWKLKNLPVVERPFAAPLLTELVPMVLIAPSEFRMESYKGDASSWKEFGRFSLELNKDRDKLPDEIVQKVKQLTAGISDDKEKVRVLYNFLQKNTRYISVQLGIGGWQPFEAAYVAQKGYGDCKALSNYMYSLLKAAGIKSNYTLVNGGYDPDDRMMEEDFPSNQFNHVILMVPFQKDTMWLECTSQTDAPGYMGSFTGNRKALAITDEGGMLVNTPKYGIRENRQVRSITGTVDAEGTLNMKVSTIYTGMRQDMLQYYQTHFPKNKMKEWLQEDLELASYDIVDFSYEEQKKSLPELKENLDIRVNNFANITGKRLFLVPNILSQGGNKIDDEERKVDFVFTDEYHNEDIEEIIIPDGYEIESMPQPVLLKTKYGTYSSSTQLSGNKIIYKRIREQFSGRFPAAEATEIRKFFSDIYKADRAKMVLVKKA